MFAALIGLIAPTVGEKFAKPIVYGGLALLILAALWGGKCAYDHSIIANHDAKVEASAAKADRQADQNQAAQATVDTSRQEQEATQLQEAINNAPKNDPTVSPAIAKRRAYYKCLSLQQRARANGLQPPSCV